MPKICISKTENGIHYDRDKSIKLSHRRYRPRKFANDSGWLKRWNKWGPANRIIPMPKDGEREYRRKHRMRAERLFWKREGFGGKKRNYS